MWVYNKNNNIRNTVCLTYYLPTLSKNGKFLLPIGFQQSIYGYYFNILIF